MVEAQSYPVEIIKPVGDLRDRYPMASVTGVKETRRLTKSALFHQAIVGELAILSSETNPDAAVQVDAFKEALAQTFPSLEDRNAIMSMIAGATPTELSMRGQQGYVDRTKKQHYKALIDKVEIRKKRGYLLFFDPSNAEIYLAIYRNNHMTNHHGEIYTAAKPYLPPHTISPQRHTTGLMVEVSLVGSELPPITCLRLDRYTQEDIREGKDNLGLVKALSGHGILAIGQ